MEEKLNRYLKGIHLEKLEINELKEVLKKYHILELPEQPGICRNETDKKKDENYLILKDIYDWALHVTLINGHRFLLKWNYPESVDSTIYLNDMIMLLYLYEINKANPLCLNNINVSPEKSVDFYKIEQSGYGNVLGLRREKDKRVVFKSIPQEDDQNEALEKASKVIRRTDETKSVIPSACQDVLPALLLSIDFDDPFIFHAEKDETPSKKFTEQEISQMLFNNNEHIKIFNKDILNNLLRITHPDGLNLMKKAYGYAHASFNINNMYRFHKRYYERLESKEKKERLNEPFLDEVCQKKANRYLSEILFGYCYCENAVQCLFKNSNENCIDSSSLKDFWDVIYSISEYPICFARIKHMELNLNKYSSPDPLKYLSKKSAAKIRRQIEAETEKDDIHIRARKKIKQKIIKQEKYTLHKFLPALFYCFLYYYETNSSLKQAFCSQTRLTIAEKLIKEPQLVMKETCNFEMYSEKDFMTFASDEIVGYLWNERRKKFFRPFVYDPEKSLF